ncbi:MAG: molybdopterin-dependent oxidoreductase, partial [Planctomycetes bacterium]|nr:molybdopterin-dependent oxidoreductase [Planctomycetota bacterium]
FLGSNPANDQPVATPYLAEAKTRGARVLVVNAFREPGMERYWVPSNPDSAMFGTKLADGFVLVKVGGDLAFLNAVAKRLIERGAYARDFVAAATTGFDAYAASLAVQDLDALAEQAGVDIATIDAFADEIARAGRGVLVWSMGITQHAHGADTVRAIANLGLLREWVGREGCGLMPIRGHSGVQGGAEMGAYATALPGGLPITPEHARHFTKLWGFPVPEAPGVPTAEWFDLARAGKLDALYCIGGNFLETMPRPDRIAEALASIPLRVHTDIVVTTQMLVEPNDVVYVLPSRTRYEQTDGGTETSTERRVIFSPYIPGHDVGEARSEWELLLDLARAVKPEGMKTLGCASGPAIRADIARANPAYAGIEKLARQGDQFQWGGPHLGAGCTFATADGKAHFQPVSPPPRRAQGERQLLLATRRGKQFNSMIQRDVDPLTGASRDHVFVSPQDAARLGLATDDPIVLKNDVGSFRGRVFVADVAPGTAQGHWPEVNVLIPDGIVDHDGGVPDYNAVVTVLRDER